MNSPSVTGIQPSRFISARRSLRTLASSPPTSPLATSSMPSARVPRARASLLDKLSTCCSWIWISGKGLDARRNGQHRVQLGGQLARVLDQRARARNVVDHAEHVLIFGLVARPIEHDLGQLVVRGGAEIIRGQLVVVDGRVVGRLQEIVQLLADRIEVTGHVLVQPERVLELTGAQHQVGAQQRAVGQLQIVRDR